MEGLSSVDRALDVLFHLHHARSPCGVSDIGRALGLPKSSTHRLLATLHRRTLVERDARGLYRPGLGLLALGLGALGHEPLVTAARAVLEREASTLGETVFLVSARAGALLVLDKVEGTGILRASPQIGSHVPAHATAVGKVYLAHAPDLVTPASRTRFTARTAVSAAELAREVEETRTRGYGVNDEEWMEGLTVVAAPVLVKGALRGALAVAVATARTKSLGTAHVGQRAATAATEVARNLEGVGT